MRKIAFIFMLGTSAPALAQGAMDTASDPSTDEQKSSVSEIVVTARQRDERLIDIPLAVTVVQREQLQRDQIFNLNDLARVSPALEVSQTFGGDTNGGGRLRGLGTNVFNPSVSSSVALVVDQAPIGNLAFPMLFDIERLDVLLGPQGTLFGQGASAGVLNVTTRRPEFDRISADGRIDVADKGTAGSEVGEITVNGGFNLPLADNLALRVAGQFRRETGLQREATRGTDNVNDDFGIRARLRYEPTETVSIIVSAEHGKSTTDGQIFFAISTIPTSPVPFGNSTIGASALADYLDPNGCNLPSISRRAEHYCEIIPSATQTSITAFSAIVDIELSDTLTLNSVSSYRTREYLQFNRDFTRRVSGLQVRRSRLDEDSSSLSQTLMLNWKTSRFDVIFGGYYSNFDFDTAPIGPAPFNFGSRVPAERIGFNICRGLDAFCVNGPTLTDETTFNRTISAFTDITVNITDKFEFFGGLRYDNFRNTTSIQNFGAVIEPVARQFVTTDSNVSGRIGVSFRPSARTNIFGLYSRGYKPPAVGTNMIGELFQLEPEIVDAFELGVRQELGRMQLSANLFHSKTVNFQGQESVGLPGRPDLGLVSTPVNIPSIVSKGLELNAFGEVLPGLSVNAGYQYNDIRYPDRFIADDRLDIGGQQFLRAPRHKATLSATYEFAIAPNLEMFVNGNMIYKSATLLAQRVGDRFRYPAHEIINTSFGIRPPDGAWTASIFVRNLTKEREPTALLAQTFGPNVDTLAVSAWPMAGFTARVVGVTLGFQY